MRKPPTGEPCTGKPPARFGGRGGREPFPTPMHEYVNHTQKEYARGEVHENRAECLFSLLKPYLRVFRGLSKFNLPGYGPVRTTLSPAERYRCIAFCISSF